MGAAIGTEEGGKSRNVELNIIPFIDLMSCLTAFLLVTAVWVNVSQLDVKAAGKARDQVTPETDEPKLSVLIESDEIWIGVSRLEEYTRIPKTDQGYDWAKFEQALKDQKASTWFAETQQIQVAAESTKTEPVSYQQLVLAMDTAVKAGFVDVRLSDPDALYARPHL
ncbi:MAG: ExbD/TolR family protein [Kofleriaceae bacterium]